MRIKNPVSRSLILQKTPSQKPDGVPNTCYKIVFRKFSVIKSKQKKALKVENTLTDYRRAYNVLGTT